MQAGILEAPSGSPDLTRAIMADQSIGEEQKQALVRIYLSFRAATTRTSGGSRARADRRPRRSQPAPPPMSPALEHPAPRMPGRSEYRVRR